jgi:hypothetical protein
MHRISVAVVAACVTAVVLVPASAAADTSHFVYTDRHIIAGLNFLPAPAGLPEGWEYMSGDATVSGADAVVYQSDVVPPQPASASVTGTLLACDTLADELVFVLFNGAGPVAEGSVHVDPQLQTGTAVASVEVEVTETRTPSCAEPGSESRTSTTVGTVAVTLTVIADGSDPITATRREFPPNSPAIILVRETVQNGLTLRADIDGSSPVPDWFGVEGFAGSASLGATSQRVIEHSP